MSAVVLAMEAAAQNIECQMSWTQLEQKDKKSGCFIRLQAISQLFFFLFQR